MVVMLLLFYSQSKPFQACSARPESWSHTDITNTDATAPVSHTDNLIEYSRK